MEAATDTKSRILEAAERLFAVHGLEGASLRAITRKAGVNLAAVNYHFGSKEGLIQTAFLQRVTPINRERLRRLSVLEGEAAGQPVELERILECFLTPVFEAGAGSALSDQLFLRLLGRLYTDAGERLLSLFLAEYEPLMERYRGALARALPELDAETLLWRMHFVVGLLAHTLLGSEWLWQYSGERCDEHGHQRVLRMMIEFSAAGLRAPAGRGPEARRDE